MGQASGHDSGESDVLLGPGVAPGASHAEFTQLTVGTGHVLALGDGFRGIFQVVPERGRKRTMCPAGPESQSRRAPPFLNIKPLFPEAAVSPTRLPPGTAPTGAAALQIATLRVTPVFITLTTGIEPLDFVPLDKAQALSTAKICGDFKAHPHRC